MKPKKKKPAAPAKRQEAKKKPAAPTAAPETPTAKPQPLSELEQRARGMALAGMRALRTVADLADFEGYPYCNESDSAEHKALLSAGKWGEALRLVSEALWALNPYVGSAMDDAGYWEAEEAVTALGDEEERAKREARNARRKAAKAEKQEALNKLKDVRNTYAFAEQLQDVWDAIDKHEKRMAKA